MKGVNFAFAGATALDYNYFNKSGVNLPGTNNSLSVQLKMFRKFKHSLCKSKKGILISPYILFFFLNKYFFNV
jgi:hypothetical protein